MIVRGTAITYDNQLDIKHGKCPVYYPFDCISSNSEVIHDGSIVVAVAITASNPYMGVRMSLDMEMLEWASRQDKHGRGEGTARTAT